MLNFKLFIVIFFAHSICFAQLNKSNKVFTKADTLRGSNNENRDWWDVLHYDITIKPDFEKKEIEGVVDIQFKIIKDISSNINIDDSIKKFFQIDLQEPMIIDFVMIVDTFIQMSSMIDSENNKSVVNNQYLNFERSSNLYRIKSPEYFNNNKPYNLIIAFKGKPQEAKKAPWDGGWVWNKDKLGRPFVSVACQGLGASSWFPCKDYQGDEADNGASLTIIVPDSLKAISNGILIKKKETVIDNTRNDLNNYFKSQISETLNDKSITLSSNKINSENKNLYTWQVKNTINTYNIIPYIGNYTNFTDTFQGEKGTLNLSYYVLNYNREKAEEHFKQVKPMLRAFEYWFGAYPFYEDGYKLVEAPYLGMEHQSAIAYGNDFKNGYKGRDLSGSGWGLKWDFIIVHESGHEWFANSITTQDIADMWVHEGFTNYSEVLFTEYYYGKQAANEYCNGLRKNIVNDIPIIGPYGVNEEGSGDMYYKAANMIHGIRNVMNDDEKFRKLLRKMNEQFYHKIVTTQQIENFIINETSIDFQKKFDQYLRTTQIPELEYFFTGRKLHYRYKNCVEGFNMPITIPSTNKTLYPTTEWQTKRLSLENKEWFNKRNIEFLYLLKVNEIEKIKD